MKRVLLAVMLVAGLFLFQGLANAVTVDLITNGDFTSGLTSWTAWSNHGGTVHANSGTLNWSHYGGRAGNATGATQTLNVDVSGYDSLVFKYRISPIYQDLTAPGWVGGNEYPASAYLNYTDTSNTAGSIAIGYSYIFNNGWYTSISHIETPPGSWYDYTSVNLLSLNFSIKTITTVSFYGSGWSYAGSADDVQLLATRNNSVPEPATMLLLGLGLVGLAGVRRKLKS